MNYEDFTKEQLIDMLKLKEPKIKLGSTEESLEHLRKYFKNNKEDFSRENMWIIILNTQNELLDIRNIFRGTIDSCTIYPREWLAFI
jgi:DNA repair protein RadC